MQKANDGEEQCLLTCSLDYERLDDDKAAEAAATTTKEQNDCDHNDAIAGNYSTN